MIDDNGFSRPTYAEIVDDLSTEWRRLFGENAQTGGHSVGGVVIRILAYVLDRLYQLAEVVYNSQFVDSAEGTTLDQLGANAGVARKAAAPGIGKVMIYGTVGYVVPSGTLFKRSDGLMYVTTEDISLTDTGHASVDVNGHTVTAPTGTVGYGASDYLYAEEQGDAYNCSIKTDLGQVTPVKEIAYAYMSDVTGGADEETDDSLRERIDLANTSVRPSSPYDGVLSAVRAVTGVNSVKIITNDTMADDPTTETPAKSVHIYVDGGYSADVGTAIFSSLAAGIATAGKTVVSCTDIAGNKHDVRFDYPAGLPVYVSVKLTKDPDQYPLDGDSTIKAAIADYIDGIGMGGTVRYTYLYKLIYDAVPGIVAADVKLGKTQNAMAAADIATSPTQTPATSLDKVVVA